MLLLPFLGGVFYTTKRITIARTASAEELQAMLLKHFPMIANQTITWHQLDGATHEFQELRLAAVTPLALRQAPGLKRSKLYLMPASVRYRNEDLEIFYIWVGYALTIDSLILIVHWQKTCPTSTHFHTRDILHVFLGSLWESQKGSPGTKKLLEKYVPILKNRSPETILRFHN